MRGPTTAVPAVVVPIAGIAWIPGALTGVAPPVRLLAPVPLPALPPVAPALARAVAAVHDAAVEAGVGLALALAGLRVQDAAVAADLVPALVAGRH
eukprot:CAMPEP_0171468146 /NCGR_PEP_ID=MMETSP0945-20130129/10419_1 /TAXON_ID=109269 /ORGANISM="Vaucheria litorea, Strain CCMP2940" /LENGTH=95 /DNA_ID=CAMNT_0011996851 /DNA_START=279 /DNA_END=563 /DNA_ORIENTATION=-